MGKESVIERVLLKVLDHFDIVKPVFDACQDCVDNQRDGRNRDVKCPACGEAPVSDALYLRRFYVFRSRFGNVYIHHICRSDDDPDPHDHPWSFASLILSGRYTDESWSFWNIRGPDADAAGDFTQEQEQGHNSKGRHFRPDELTCLGIRFPDVMEAVKPGSLVFRRAEHIHRVLLDGGPVWSLVVTGPERRPWGFVTQKRWVFWREYLNVWNSKDHA